MPQIEQSAVRNRLLAALPPDVFADLAPFLRLVDLRLKQDLQVAEQPIEYAYFIESGMVSMLAELEAGQSMEVGISGLEGMAGLPIVHGNHVATTTATVQLPGQALRIDPARLRGALDSLPTLQQSLLRYAQAFHAQVAQSAAWNGHHVVEERLARWLLMAHDRAGSDTFYLTQEYLSRMLGVRRAGVTVAVGILQRTGCIRRGQRRITVVDRKALEAASCECYGIVRRHFERLIGR